MAVEPAMAADPAAQKAVEPSELTGLWRAIGVNVAGEMEEEFLQLDVSSVGVVTGMVDSDGDGVWSEEDCRLANGVFDAQTSQLRFDQVYDDSPPVADVQSGFDKTAWVGRYDASSGLIVDGKWSTTAGVIGKFRLERTTEEQMRNRVTAASSPPDTFTGKHLQELRITGLRTQGTPGQPGSVDWVTAPDKERVYPTPPPSRDGLASRGGTSVSARPGSVPYRTLPPSRETLPDLLIDELFAKACHENPAIPGIAELPDQALLNVLLNPATLVVDGAKEACERELASRVSLTLPRLRPAGAEAILTCVECPRGARFVTRFGGLREIDVRNSIELGDAGLTTLSTAFPVTLSVLNIRHTVRTIMNFAFKTRNCVQKSHKSENFFNLK